MVLHCCIYSTGLIESRFIQSFLCPVVESLSKSRQPLPHLEAIYVVVPSEENIEAIKKDYSGTSPMYKAAHIFFLESKSLSLSETLL